MSFKNKVNKSIDWNHTVQLKCLSLNHSQIEAKRNKKNTANIWHGNDVLKYFKKLKNIVSYGNHGQMHKHDVNFAIRTVSNGNPVTYIDRVRLKYNLLKILQVIIPFIFFHPFFTLPIVTLAIVKIEQKSIVHLTIN